MKEIAVFLLFDQSATEFFQTVIDRLAEKHGSVKFPPHITLYFGQAEEGTLSRHLEKISTSCAQFELELTEIASAESFWRALFIKLKSSVALMSLQHSVMQVIPNSAYNFIPHISLFYGDPAAVKGKDVPQLSAFRKTLRATGISLIGVSDDAVGWERPDNWKELLRIDLSEHAA